MKPGRERKKITIGNLPLWIGRIVFVCAAVLIWLWLVNSVYGPWAGLKNYDWSINNPWVEVVAKVVGSVVFGLVLLFSTRAILVAFVKLYNIIERPLAKYSGKQILMGLVGLIIGLAVVLIINLIVYLSTGGTFLPLFVSVILGIILGFVGLMLGVRRMSEVLGAPKQAVEAESGTPAERPNILDSSAIIDGRVLDVLRAGFIDGALLVPVFVLSELRHITDNPDILKRNRGKRGLDVINALQQAKGATVVMDETDYDEGDTDAKILRLAKEKNGKIITNDYNLNKVASLKEIKVLNINELANAIKPVALPGEKMKLKLVKEGKEPGQAVGYLADGTMIVAENGGKFVGSEVEVTITTSLQTAAGRIIFGRI